MRKIPFVFLALIFLSACQRTEYTAEIRQIDSLVIVLDTMRNIHRRIDTTGYEQAMEAYAERMAAVGKLYSERGDTMNYEVGMMMAEYRELKKPLEKFKRKYAEVATELDFSRTQLLDLKHDLEHNLLDTNIVNKMLRSESEAVEKIVAETNELQTSHQITLKKTESMEPAVDSLIQALETDTLSTE